MEPKKKVRKDSIAILRDYANRILAKDYFGDQRPKVDSQGSADTGYYDGGGPSSLTTDDDAFTLEKLMPSSESIQVDLHASPSARRHTTPNVLDGYDKSPFANGRSVLRSSSSADTVLSIVRQRTVEAGRAKSNFFLHRLQIFFPSVWKWIVSKSSGFLKFSCSVLG